MFAELNNHVSTVREGIDISKYDFVPLKEFIGGLILVDGFFFTDSKYGKQVVVVGNGKKINMPARAVEQFETIMKNEEMLKAVLNGGLVLKNIKSVSTKNGTTTAYDLADR